MANIITGENAEVKISEADTTLYALSDFSLELSRDVNEQEIVGSAGNEFHEGPISIEGSYTSCKFAASGNSASLDSIVEGSVISISGQITGNTYVSWYFPSCQVTSYDVTGGDASTISEASIDFTVMNPKDVSYESGQVSCT